MHKKEITNIAFKISLAPWNRVLPKQGNCSSFSSFQKPHMHDKKQIVFLNLFKALLSNREENCSETSKNGNLNGLQCLGTLPAALHKLFIKGMFLYFWSTCWFALALAPANLYSILRNRSASHLIETWSLDRKRWLASTVNKPLYPTFTHTCTK